MTNLQYKLLEKLPSLLKKTEWLYIQLVQSNRKKISRVVKKFLNEHQNFILKNAGEEFPKELVDENGCIQTFPHVHQMDGAFAAKLIRVDIIFNNNCEIFLCWRTLRKN